MKVGIQNKEGWLILVWNDGKRRTMAVGMRDTPVARAVVQKKAAQIELDYQLGDDRYDRTLLKYKPRTLGKSGTEISAPELFERFTKSRAKEKGLSDYSIECRYLPLRKMLDKHLNYPASEIDRHKAEKLAEVCARTLQPSTAKARISLLFSCWEWARGKYHIAEDNPFIGLGDRFKPQQKPQPRPFSDTEVRAILIGFRSSKYYSHYADFVAFLFGVGCRFGEAVGLRWENVAHDFKSIYICQSLTRGSVGGTKTGRSRTVNLSPSIATLLEARYRSQQPQPSDLVFTTPTGLPIDDRSFRRRAWAKVLAAVGVPYRKPYTSRSTAISHALAAGVDYISVAKAAGHSPQVLHDHYANVIENKSVFVDFGE